MNYEQRCAEASREQGIDDLISELGKHDIKATSEQTGGFTMCACVSLPNGEFIYANPYGAGLYTDEDYIRDIIQLDEADIATVASSVARFAKAAAL